MNSKYRILIVPGMIPFPPDSGGKICIYAFIESLRFEHDIHLFVPTYSLEDTALIAQLQKSLPEVTIHAPQLSVLAKNQDNFNSSLVQIKHSIKQNLQTIKSVFKSNLKNASKNSAWATHVAVPPFTTYSEDYVMALKALFKKEKFDIVQSEYTNTLSLVSLIPSGTCKIFVDLESRFSVVKDIGNVNGIHKDYVDYVSNHIRTLEHSFFKKYDAIFTLNKIDYEEVKNSIPSLKVFNSPFPVLDSQISDQRPSDFIPQKLVFMGGQNHSPNIDALHWFLEEIYPLLNAAKDLPLFVTGNWDKNTRQSFQRLNSKLTFTGLLGDLKPTLVNSISIVPIRLGGGGLRSKVIHSMAAGIPIVSTSLACVGMESEHEREYLIADSAKDFAKQLDRLMVDADLSKSLIKNGKEFVAKNFGQKYLAEKRNSFYQALMKK